MDRPGDLQARQELRQRLKQIRRALSGDRLDAFRGDPEDTNLDLLGRYGCDVALSAALYAPLRACEVVLRNAVHTAIAKKYPLPRTAKPCFPTAELDEHHNCTVSWLDQRPSLLLAANAASVGEAKERLHRRCARHKREYTAGRLIAELNLNFWVTLFSGPYGYQGEAPMSPWPELLPEVFPHLPAEQASRRAISDRLQRIKKLRNRVFHHEPVWRHNIAAEYENVIEVIAFINPAAADMVRSFNCVPAALHPRLPERMRRRIAKM